MSTKAKHNRLVAFTVAAVAIVILICVSFFIANIQPGHWLISNNLAYPELVPAVSGQSDLITVINREVATGNFYRIPGEIISLGLKLLLPASAVRYAYLGLLMLAGSLGTFWLCRQWLWQRRHTNSIDIGAFVAAAAYTGSVFSIQAFYALDLGLIAALAFLPWLLLFTYLFITSGKHIWLWLFVIVSILGLEVGGNFIMGIAVILLPLLFGLTLRNHKSWLGRWSSLNFLGIIINLAWLVPAVYKLISGAGLQLMNDVTVSQHLPTLLQLVNSGSFNQVVIVNQFQADWVSYWQSPAVLIAVFLPIVVTAIAAVWALVSRPGISRVLGAVTLACLGLWLGINAAISSNIITWTGIGSVKQILSLIIAIATALLIGRLVNWLISVQLPKLTKLLWLPALVTAITVLFYVVLVCIPVYQNHLYPTNSQAALPESFPQLYDYFRLNHTPGNILYVTESQQQDPKSLEFSTTSLPLDNYALPQPLITFSDPLTHTAYVNLVDIISSGNANQIAAAWEKYNIDWVIVDQANLQSDIAAVNPQLGQVVASLASVQKVTWIDAGHNELTFFQITGRTNSKLLTLGTPAFVTSAPLADISSIDSTADFVIPDADTNTVVYPFRNLNSVPVQIDATANTATFTATVPQNSLSNLVLPALAQLNLENVTLKLTPAGSQLQVDLLNAYPQITVDHSEINGNLTDIVLGKINMPANKYMLVLGTQIWGPFTPGQTTTVAIPELTLAADQNMRVYELYDTNNVTAQFAQNQARNCVTYANIAGGTTTVDSTGIHISSPEDICIAADVPIIETDASVLTRTSFDYTTNVALSQCMFSKVSSDCINHNLPSGTADSQNHTLQVVEELGKVGTRDLQTKFFFTRNGSQSTRAATLNNINIEEYKLIDSQTVSIPTWKAAQTITIHGAGNIQAQIPLAAVAAADFNSGEFVDSFKSCADNETITLVSQPQRELQISANGQLCVNKDYAVASTAKASFILLNYSLASGNPVNLCVWDTTRNLCQQNVQLTGNGSSQQVLVQIPRHGADATTYQLHFYTNGSFNSNLVISDLQFVTADTDTLQGLYLSANAVTDTTVNALAATSGIVGYQISPSSTVSTNNLTVMFSHTFDPVNWKLENTQFTNPFSLLAGAVGSVPAKMANGWQLSWTTTPGDYYLVNMSSLLIEVVIVLQALNLFLFLIIPTAKEVFISGIMRSAARRS